MVGAGLAGLSCAQTLQDAGLTVTVVDKSRGLAGRMSTRRGDTWACDHGAQYFTAHDPAFRAEVSRWLEAGVAALWQPRIEVFDRPAGADGNEEVERFVGTPRMTAPARLLADGLTLHAGLTVSALQRGTEGWHVLTAEKGLLKERFDAVVLALPAPQATPLLASLSSSLADVAAQGQMQGCWALMLRFESALALPFDAAFVNQGPLRWIARDSSKPGRTGQETWSLHASAAWSEAHIEADADTVAALLIEAFKALGGSAPSAWSAHRWRYAITSSAVDGGCVWDAATGLGLCGDWLNGGRIEGAWLSGQALGRQILSSAGVGTARIGADQARTPGQG